MSLSMALFFCSELRLSAMAEPEVNPNRTVELNSDSDFLIDQPGYDPKYPSYLKTPSRMALGLRAAINGFPHPSSLGSLYQFYAEYVFPWQKAGSLSLGALFGSFPLHDADSGIPGRHYDNAVAGALLRYQFRYTPQQFLVPTASVEWQYYRINEPALSANPISGNDFGVSGGLMLNLSFIDRQTAFDAYKSVGLVRTYFTGEVRSCNLSNEFFSLSGLYWLWGIRLEFE